MHDFATLLAALLFWHALADFPLQGDFLARAKNDTAPIPNVSSKLAMTWHCMIHFFGVYVITGSFLLGVCEFVFHRIIDNMKNDQVIDFEKDQQLHTLCKLGWTAIVIWGPLPHAGLWQYLP